MGISFFIGLLLVYDPHGAQDLPRYFLRRSAPDLTALVLLRGCHPAITRVAVGYQLVTAMQVSLLAAQSPERVPEPISSRGGVFDEAADDGYERRAGLHWGQSLTLTPPQVAHDVGVPAGCGREEVRVALHTPVSANGRLS